MSGAIGNRILAETGLEKGEKNHDRRKKNLQRMWKEVSGMG